jgi:copper chaperone NosL
MGNMKTSSRLLMTGSALLLILISFVPIWQIQMWAPQYPEWLQMRIWINDITGDISIINGLNHYIGMKYIQADMFPEFQIMPYILAGIIALGFILALVGKKFGLYTYLTVLVLAGIAGFLDFYYWTYDYGHNLDPTAAIKVPGMSYQPPLLGSKELLNFIAYAAPDVGGYAALGAGLMVIGAVWIEWKAPKKSIKSPYGKVVYK